MTQRRRSIRIGIRPRNGLYRNGTGLDPAGFEGDKGSDDEQEEEGQDGGEKNAPQKVRREGDQNRICAHRRHESFIHW